MMTRKDAASTSTKDDYLGNHFSDVRRSAADQRGAAFDPLRGGREDVDNLTMAQKVVRQQKDLEKLLIHADNDNISMHNCTVVIAKQLVRILYCFVYFQIYI